MASEKRKFAKNAVSNIVNGASAAVFAIVLPFFFVRYLDRAEFAVWVLVLQLAAYANYLNFGLQVAVGRYVSHALEMGDRTGAERIVAAGVQILLVLGGLAFVVIAAVAAAFPHLFRQVPPHLIGTAQATLLWIGAAIAAGMPFMAFLGVFVGLQRNEIPAWISGIGKSVVAAGVIIAARSGASLAGIGAVYFCASLCIYVVQYVAFVLVCRGWSVRLFDISRVEIRELASYCLSLMVWTLAMLLINGLDTTIVGIFDFRSVAAYGVALSIVTFFAGVIQALLAPTIQVFAKMQARGESDKMMRLLHVSSLACSLFLLLTASVLVALAHPLFEIWVGPSLARAALPLFEILIVANAIRYTALPYTNYLIATGQQRRVILSPIVEGCTNFAVSIIAVRFFGAAGVALGTLIGGVAAIAMNHFYNFPRTTPAGSSVWAMVGSAIGKPAMYASPVLILAALQIGGWLPLYAGAGFVALASVASGGLFVRRLGSIRQTDPVRI